MVQQYDVTKLLAEENTWTIVLADGWYAGRVSVQGGSGQFGEELGVIAELEITYADETKSLVGTDESFCAFTGKYVYSDIFIGEKQDLRQDIPLDSIPKKGVKSVRIQSYDNHNLLYQTGPQVNERETLPAQKIWQENGSWIVDFGQVVAGYVEMELFLDYGQEITVEHSEVLNSSGQFINNIIGRNKDQTDKYIGRGHNESLSPDFTFHGFRYIRLTGLESEIKKEQFQAKVIYSELKETGRFWSSNEDLNKLMQNIQWSQKGNMISIPTDCPQRERVGWTGDTQVFVSTATFFYDMKDFLLRWLDNVACEQRSDGEILDYTPAPKDFYKGIEFTGSLSSAGWGDAIILVPWELYLKYDDINILRTYYKSMVKWHEYSKKSAAGNKSGYKKFIWDTKFHYGDWMFPSYMMGEDPPGAMATAKATKDLVATAYLANSSFLLAKISDILGKDSSVFKDYYEEVRNAFNIEFVNNDGKLTCSYQGCYVLTVAFDLVDDKRTMINQLVELIKENNYRLDTGFLSINYLLDVLCDNGQEPIALKLLYQRNCPSWLYEVDNGATTIWESWTAIQPDGEVTKSSFNHYAFGCVGDWIVRRIGGLKLIKPGYKEFRVDPLLHENVEKFEISFRSKYGTIRISRSLDVLKINVPKSTKAYLWNTDKVLEEGLHTINLKEDLT